MKLVGITGGIGTGKSTVAGILQKRGWTVYESDATSKELMATDGELRAELAAHFGSEVLTTNGVNATVLAQLVFGPSAEHQERLNTLNRLVHPRVLQAHMDAIAHEHESGTPIVAIASALLFEAELEEGFDWVIVVDAPEELCIQRVVARQNLAPEEVRRRMERQMPMEQKRGLADFVIENAGTPEELQNATDLVALLIETM